MKKRAKKKKVDIASVRRDLKLAQKRINAAMATQDLMTMLDGLEDMADCFRAIDQLVTLTKKKP